MTTHRDWLFRAEHMRMTARHLRLRAAALILEAEHYENLGNAAEKTAVDGALTNLENAVAGGQT